ERLGEIKGIPKAKRSAILASWKEQRAAGDAMAFLQGHGIGSARAVRVFKRYGAATIERVREKPWMLASDIGGIGFTTADEMAGSMGVDRRSPARARAGIVHTLSELTADGHCAFPEADLTREAARLLAIDEAVVGDAIGAEIAGGRVIRDRRDGQAW